VAQFVAQLLVENVKKGAKRGADVTAFTKKFERPHFTQYPQLVLALLQAFISMYAHTAAQHAGDFFIATPHIHQNSCPFDGQNRMVEYNVIIHVVTA
jgi:hypothetical protein